MYLRILSSILFLCVEDGVVDFCYAATQLADVINGVSNEHAKATIKLFKELYARYYHQEFNAPVIGVLNGSGDSWVHPELRAIEDSGRLATQEEIVEYPSVWAEQKLLRKYERRTGISLDPNKPTFWEVRRIVDYKSQYPILKFLVHLICAETTESFTRDSLREAWFRDITGLREGYNGNQYDLNGHC